MNKLLKASVFMTAVVISSASFAIATNGAPNGSTGAAIGPNPSGAAPAGQNAVAPNGSNNSNIARGVPDSTGAGSSMNTSAGATPSTSTTEPAGAGSTANSSAGAMGVTPEGGAAADADATPAMPAQ